MLYRILNLRRFCTAAGDAPKIMKYLNVAEKNDAAKTIAGHLSNGTNSRVSLNPITGPFVQSHP